jgi:hypothetical protein
MLCPELGVVSIELFTNFQYNFCPIAAKYRERHISMKLVALLSWKRCLRFDLHCAPPLVLLISKLEYFVADATYIFAFLRERFARSHESELNFKSIIYVGWTCQAQPPTTWRPT